MRPFHYIFIKWGSKVLSNYFFYLIVIIIINYLNLRSALIIIVENSEKNSWRPRVDANHQPCSYNLKDLSILDPF